MKVAARSATVARSTPGRIQARRLVGRIGGRSVMPGLSSAVGSLDDRPMSGRAEGAPRMASRRDLLAYLDRLRRVSGEVRRVEAYRSRGWPARRIAAEAERVAGQLAAHGIGDGARVAIWVHDGPLWQVAFFGILRAGAVAVPLEASADLREARDAARALAIAAWCTDGEAPSPGTDAPVIEVEMRTIARRPSGGAPGRRRGPETGDFPAPVSPPLPPDDPDRPAEIVLTSGTSMAARPVSVAHGNMRAVLDALEAGIGPYRRWLRIAPRLRIACALPLSHLYGQVLGVFVPP